jgi:acyl carrier protein
MAIEATAASKVEVVLRKYIAENLLFTDGDLPIGDDDSFIENGIVDSTGILELVLFVEEAFDMKVQDSDVVPENFDSVARLAGYIRARLYRKV